VEEEGGAVAKEGVALHLTQPDASRTLPALDWLLREVVHWPSSPDLELVRDHVTQALVVDQADEDVRTQGQARHTAVHGLVAVVVVTCLLELLTEKVDRSVLLRESNSQKKKKKKRGESQARAKSQRKEGNQTAATYLKGVAS